MNTYRIRNVPLVTKEHLKDESDFGCVICGCPLLEYISTISSNGNSNKSASTAENIVSVCPNCRAKCHNGGITDLQLRNAKTNPHNKTHPKDAFRLDKVELTVKVGKSTFVNTPRILVVNDFDVITIDRAKDAFLIMDLNFFDRLSNNLIAAVLRNDWMYFDGVWNIDYVNRRLSIRHTTQGISLEILIKDEEVQLLADGIYYNGHLIRINEDGIWLDDSEIGIELKQCVLKNYEVGINIQAD
ncbi:MAG TPA: hypothetical protein VE089_09265 [Nitrososphaeraceae archaeon]|nr:hypothetical protein [Nitrososphaeraceae archaeon]